MVNYESKKIGSVKGLGDIYQNIAPLDEQLKSFRKVGIDGLVSPQETAMIRLAGVSNDFTRTNMVPVGVEGENPILYRDSPFMNPAMAKLAVEAHREGKFPTLPRDFYEAVKEYARVNEGLEPEDRIAIVLSSSENYNLTPEMDETRFILGKQTQEYFKKFNHSNIPLYNLFTKDVDKKHCNVNYLWFNGPVSVSGLDAGDRCLNYVNSSFGVLRSAEGASAQKSRYSLTEIEKANSEIIPIVFNQEGLSGITSQIVRPLNKMLLEKLRIGKQ